MGKKSSATAIDTIKKAKRIATGRDPNAPPVGVWDRTKFTAKDLRKLIKEDFMKEDSNAIKIPGPETTSVPPAGYRVMFLAFFYRGLSLPVHQFLRSLLFAYRVQLMI
jgi:hypothetical protein